LTFFVLFFRRYAFYVLRCTGSLSILLFFSDFISLKNIIIISVFIEMFNSVHAFISDMLVENGFNCSTTQYMLSH